MAETRNKSDFNQWGPKTAPKGKGGQIKFLKPEEEWKETKVWEFTQIQALVNLLTTRYRDVKPIRIESAKVRVDWAIKSAVSCGFFKPGECTTKAHVDAHIATWLPYLLQCNFIQYMATLQALLGRASHPHKDASMLKTNYKSAKSALNKKRFSTAATDILYRIINTLVQQK